jgi:hypothetical protein
MMRDNLVGLIEPMVYRAGVHSLAGHHQARQTGRCSRSTELAIVALKRSWRQIFRWKTGRRAENSNWPAWEMTTAAHDSRAVGTACHQSHRTIDPQCLTKSPPRRGGIFALTKNVASPVHAEPAQYIHVIDIKWGNCHRKSIAYSIQASQRNLPDAAAQPIRGGIAPGKAPTNIHSAVFRLSGV